MIPVEYNTKINCINYLKIMINYSFIKMIYCDKIRYRNSDKYFIDVFYGNSTLHNGKIVIDHNNIYCIMVNYNFSIKKIQVWRI
jgi:hypothetical protein